MSSVECIFQCPISQLMKMIFTCNFKGCLIDHQPCFVQSFKFLAVQEPVFLKSKLGQNRPLTGFCIYIIGPASIFFSLLGFDFGVM